MNGPQQSLSKIRAPGGSPGLSTPGAKSADTVSAKSPTPINPYFNLASASPGLSSHLESIKSCTQTYTPTPSLIPETLTTHGIPEPSSEGATWKQAVINSANLLIGIGMLAYPSGMAYAGWVGMILLVSLMLLTRYTATIISKILYENPDCRTFTDIGRKAFGIPGTVFITTVFFMELIIGSCASYLVGSLDKLPAEFTQERFWGILQIVFADNLHKLFPSISFSTFALIGAATVLPTTWLRDLSRLSYLSFLGFFAGIAVIGVLLFVGFDTTSGGSESFHNRAETDIANWAGLPFSIGIFMIGFSGHAVFPVIYSSMQNKKEFGKSINVTYCLTLACYGGIALMGYLLYGRETKAEITLNLPDGVLTKITLWTIVINTVSKFALTLAPVGEVVENILDTVPSLRIDAEMISELKEEEDEYSHLSVSQQKFSDQYDEAAFLEHCREPTPVSPSKLSNKSGYSILESPKSTQKIGSVLNLRSETKIYIRGIAIRTVLTGIVLLIALFLPYFDRIMSFSGALLSFSVSVVFPPLALIRLRELNGMGIKCSFKIANWVVGSFGVICAIIGTISSFTGEW